MPRHCHHGRARWVGGGQAKDMPVVQLGIHPLALPWTHCTLRICRTLPRAGLHETPVRVHQDSYGDAGRSRCAAVNITKAVRPGAGSKKRELVSLTITEPT